MYTNHLWRFLLPLVLVGLLAAGCSPAASTETKAAPEAKSAPAPAPVESAPAPAPPPPAPAEKPRRVDERKAAPVATVPPQVVAPQAAPAPAPAPAPVPVAQPAPVNPAPAPVATQPAPPQPAPINVVDTKNVVLPAGTAITVTMIDSVNSETGNVGDTFRASIDSPITIDNDVVLQRGADAVVRLTEVSSAGKVRGQSELQLVLDRVSVGRKSYTVDTNVYEQQGAEQGKKAVRNGALGAALGAAIGAIAGGGKGAAIGAGAGAGGGVGATAIMKGEQVQVPSETRLQFTLKQPVTVSVTPGLPSSITRQNAAPQRDRFNVSPQQTDPNDRPRVRRSQPLQ